MNNEDKHSFVVNWKSDINISKLMTRECQQKGIKDEIQFIHKRQKIMYNFNEAKSRKDNLNQTIRSKSLNESASHILRDCRETWITSPYLQGGFGLFIMIATIFHSMLITCWPQHNIFEYPEYWFEPLAPIFIGYFVADTANTLINSAIVMSSNTIKSWKKFFQLLILQTLGFIIPYIVIYIIWVHVLNNKNPMPFIGKVCLTISYITKIVSFWFLFPRSERSNKDYRKKLIGYMLLFPTFLFISQVYGQLSALFLNVPLHFQWCLGVFLPMLKKFNMWISTKIAFKASGGPTLSAKLAMICGVGGLHSFMIVLLLASAVQPTTAYLVMILDSLPNLWSVISIVRMHKKQLSSTLPDDRNQTRNQIQEALTCLSLKEFLELLIPMIYGVSFVIAFYGPNAEILGNIKNDYWQFEKVDSLIDKLSNVGIFFCVDSFRCILSASIIWYFSGLNVYKPYCYLMLHYGFLILYYISAALNLVSQQYHLFAL